MNKAISVAAILALSAASSELTDHELINLHLEQARPHRPTFSPLVHDIAHDDEQMIRLTPEIMKPHYRTFTPLAADDNDDEFVYANALRLDDNNDQYFAAPGLVADDEFYVEEADNELNFLKKIGNGLKKAGKFVVSHPQIITTAAKFLDDNDDEFFAHDAAQTKKTQRLRASHEALQKASVENKAVLQDSLSNLKALLKEDKRVQLPKRPIQIQEVQDNNLSIKDKLKKAADWVGDHPQVITEAAKTYKVLKGKK